MSELVETNGKCPVCGSPAYVGIVLVLCSFQSCRLYDTSVIGPDEAANEDSWDTDCGWDGVESDDSLADD